MIVFRDECETLRQSVLMQQKEESDAALKQVMSLKEHELDAYKRELQSQIGRYQQQVGRAWIRVYIPIDGRQI